MSKDTIETGARRRFLRTLGVAGAAAATLPLAGAKPAAARESREEMKKRRYQANSPDVQAFYRTNRYER
ncbi:twin-arginine translocation signal domain-containing protein [Elioraea tepidiphila]|jgi:hypothetical protein|uniref:twin-arginine translocation signal domain-containing protein n=1 Tax=Elioraea tepidiphila TaxID=457934 RepID=UPI000365BD66|nr:twin-arginine translocation signal domain-containing protein [Elioraea tepidiphila]